MSSLCSLSASGLKALLSVASRLPAGNFTMHDDRDPFRAPAREPKPGTFHRPPRGVGVKRAHESAEVRLSGPMSGEQKLGEGLPNLPLVGNAKLARTKDKA
jgi:hypothetical protein